MTNRHPRSVSGKALDQAIQPYARRLGRFNLFAVFCPKEHDVYAILDGPTFPYDQLLRASGAVWQESNQSWVFDSKESLTCFADALDQLQQPDCVGLAEESTAFIGASDLQEPLSRLLYLGANALRNEDLLELILSFDPYLDDPSLTSRRLFDEFGSLGAILNSEPVRLARFKEITPRLRGLLQAVQLTIERVLHEPIQQNPVIGSSQALLTYLRGRLQHRQREELLVLYLDKKNRLIKIELAEGTIDHLPLYPRDVATRALELFADGVILAHNHPAGNMQPSKADIETTNHVRNALEALRIKLYDHVIICKQSHFSFKAEGLL